jgi:hypothetical protein
MDHLAGTDPRFAALIARRGLTVAHIVRLFDLLAESIAYQQLSGKAAATPGRVRAWDEGKWFDPKLVLATSMKPASSGFRAPKRPR